MAVMTKLKFRGPIAFVTMLCLVFPVVAKASDIGDLIEDISNVQSYLHVTGSCDISEQLRDTGGLNALGLVKGKGKGEKTRRFHTENALQKAVSLGANYALIAPLKITNQADYWSEVRYGWGRARKVEVKGREYRVYRVPCLAVDDLAAFDLMWSADADRMLAEQGLMLVDIREMAVRHDLDIQAGSSKQMIAEKRNRQVGDREANLGIYPIKKQAAACRSGLVPVSTEDYVPRRNRASEMACLSPLKDSAEQAGWTEFPLLAEAADEARSARGFKLNRPSTPTQPKANAEQAADISRWGSRWTDHTIRLNMTGGAALRSEDEKYAIIASDNLGFDDLIDRAVFLLAEGQLDSRYSGLRMQDLTQIQKDKFDSHRRKMIERVERESERKRDKSEERDIRRLERDFQRLEEDLDEVNAIDPTDTSDLEESLAMMEALPQGAGADFDADAVRAQMVEARKKGVEAKREALLLRKAKLQKELDSARATLSQIETKQMATGVTIGRASDDYSQNTTLPTRAAFRAFEDYRTVLVISVNSSNSSCRAADLVCADKLEAFNTIGPRVVASGFTPFSVPVGYSAYDP